METTSDIKQFSKLFQLFCNDLCETFPELSAQIDRALSVVTPKRFWNSWSSTLDILVSRDVSRLFSDRRGILVAPIHLSPSLWNDVSPTTHDAIWKYLRTLILEAINDKSLESESADFSLTEEQSRELLTILMEERHSESVPTNPTSSSQFTEMIGSLTKELFGDMSGMFDKLKSFVQTQEKGEGEGEGKDKEAEKESIPIPDLPEHLKNGRLMKLAKDLAQQFRPEEFGIDSTIVSNQNIEEVLRHLAEMYQRDPTPLISGAKNMAERIRKQVLGGSLKPDEIITEAREIISLLKDHPLFKDAISKFEELVGEDGLTGMFGGNKSAPSERLRATQERMRRKLAARQAKK